MKESQKPMDNAEPENEKWAMVRFTDKGDSWGGLVYAVTLEKAQDLQTAISEKMSLEVRG